MSEFDMQAFPNLGGIIGEVGPGTSPGGIGGPWPMNLPLQYYWQGYGHRKVKKSKSKSKKRSKKRSKKCKKSYKKKKC